jgi:hypothetical protein
MGEPELEDYSTDCTGMMKRGQIDFAIGMSEVANAAAPLPESS